MYVYDNVRVICDLMFDDEVVNQVMNIGTGIRLTNLEIISKIGEILNKEVQFNYVEDRLGHDRKYGLNCGKLRGYYEKHGGRNWEFMNLDDYLIKQYKS
jgi:dTDP-glucose 4,6-dehydratase